ncbi:MAG TPA: HlyD family efflux transporter periplasmic adaptor subunit [Myxococcales bacterium]|nr:HlyD family efflux transporter periplasmic adaptor subunit [Myxococcales bacterium]
MKKIIYVLVGVAAVALIAIAARPKPLEVEASPVTRGPFRQIVDEDGKTRVRERYMVSAPVAGTLARIELHAGDAVEPGTVIARLLPLPSPLLDPRARDIAEQHLASTRDAQSQAAAAVVRGEAAARLADITLARDKELAAQNAVTAQQVEKDEADDRMQKSELESLRFAQKVAAHAVDEARLALESFSARAGTSEQMQLTSPVHGRVLHVLHEDAGVVQAGTALVEIGDPATLEIVVAVLSQDAVTIRAGMTATLSHWGGPNELRAHVRRVEPSGFTRLSALGVEEQRVNVLLDLDDPADGKALGDGFALEAQILTWSGEEVPQIPTSALFRQGKSWAVFAIDEGKAVVKPVQIGHRGPLRTELVEGLEAGELVISHPAPTLKAGVHVRPAAS